MGKMLGIYRTSMTYHYSISFDIWLQDHRFRFFSFNIIFDFRWVIEVLSPANLENWPVGEDIKLNYQWPMGANYLGDPWNIKLVNHLFYEQLCYLNHTYIHTYKQTYIPSSKATHCRHHSHTGSLCQIWCPCWQIDRDVRWAPLSPVLSSWRNLNL